MVASITNSREMDTVLPNRVNVTYLDYNREYDPNEQYAQRMTKETVGVTSLDLAIVMTPTEAARCAEVLLYMYWLERNDVSFSLPPTYNRLEAGDCVTIEANEGTYSVRLTEITYTPEGRLECKGKYNSPATYVSSAQGGDGTAPDQTLAPAGNTEIILLDIPCLLDSYNTPGYIAAATGYSTEWPGGVVYRTDDDGQTWTILQGFVSPGSEMGYALNSIGVSRTDIFDTSSVLQVSFIQGSINSETELNVLNGVNWFAYGAEGRWEIIGVKTATLQADGSYVFIDILRGRKGTEWAMGKHAIGDAIVLLDTNSVSFISVNSSTIGVSRGYKGVTSEQLIDDVDSTNFAYQGVNLECLSPIYLNGNRSNANNWVLTWVRRSRIDVEWRDYVEVAVGETAEQYIVEFYSDATYAVLKHTSETLTTPTYTYPATGTISQTTDFGSSQQTLYCKIYQLSSVVGRGYPLTEQITRSGTPLTSLLMHMDISPFVDVYGHVITNTGVTRSSVQSKFGGYSALFNGSSYFEITSTDALIFRTEDFTIEAQVYFTANTMYNPIFSKSSGLDYFFSIGPISSGGKLTWDVGLGTSVLADTEAFPLNQWVHVAVSRRDGVLYLFKGGEMVASADHTYDITATGAARIGRGRGTSTNYATGYIDEVRVTKGFGLYVGNFTPPTSAFTQ